jgi:peptidoglycan LD-endopeptidase CwlK
MSFSYGKKSIERLAECHLDLQEIAHELIKEMNVTVLCGHRGEEEQTQAFINGKSKLRWPNSKHNKKPSEAIDLAPFPIDWKDIKGFIDMCSRIERIANELGIHIRLGRDFSFKDYPHIELIKNSSLIA